MQDRPAALEEANALRALSHAVALTQSKVNAVVEALHGGFSAPARMTLRSVVEIGPMTVPQIAALRPVSRQYVQSVVDELKAAGLVELVENTAHKRSKLVQATAHGARLMAEMTTRETPVLAAGFAAVDTTLYDVRAAAELLTRLNAHMDASLATLKGERTDDS